MHIHHVAIWAQDLEALKAFYCTLFGGQANERYHNPTKQFSSYFVHFEGGASLELMHSPTLFPASEIPSFLETQIIPSVRVYKRCCFR